MDSSTQNLLSVAEYYAAEVEAEHRSEYENGVIFPRIGMTRVNNRITMRLLMLFKEYILEDRVCEVLSSLAPVRVTPTVFYYPDLSVTCGDLEFKEGEIDYLLNPTMIIEVLADSTEQRDRGIKFRNYRACPSVQDYVLISHDKPMIEHFARRSDNTWILRVAEGWDATLYLPAMDFYLSLEQVYRGIVAQ